MILNPKLNELNFTGTCIALDLETTGLFAWKNKIKLISITDELGFGYVLEVGKYKHEDLKTFFEDLRGCYKIINQNLKFDCGFIFYHYGVLLRNVHCTQVSQQILENGKQKLLDFDLVSILQRTLAVQHSVGDKKSIMQKSFTKKEIELALDLMPSFKQQQFEYALEDTKHLIRLYRWQMNKLELGKLMIVYKLEMKLLPILVKMEIEGCLIDARLWRHQIKTYWEKDQEQVIHRLDEVVNKIIAGGSFGYHCNRISRSSTQFDIFGGTSTIEVEDPSLFNYSSQPHVLALFDFVGETPPMIETKNKEGVTELRPSVEEGALQIYLTEHGDTKLSEFLEILLEYRQITKLLSTYGEGFLAQLDDRGHIHTQYTQTTTETGRLSSKTPNLQNIPKPTKKEPNKDIRKCFIAAPGHKFITCDMAAAEVRIAADYSQDELLLGSLKSGVDMHSKLASVSYSIIFGRPVEIKNTSDEVEIDGYKYVLEELRGTHKSVVFAKFYKGGASIVYEVLSKYINTHHKDVSTRMAIASAISKAIDKELPRLSAYLSGLISRAQRDGWLIASVFGRIRHFNKSKVYGEAANYPMITQYVVY